jgi:UDP-glucose 4-epimerase
MVTGSAGFIGGHVARHLIEHDWEVTGFDTSTAPRAGYRQIEGDLRDPEAVHRAVMGQDVVCHIGAIGDVYAAAEQPALAAAVNAVGSAHVAAAAAQAGARVVYASTWEVYGEPEYEPIDEDHPCAPDHPYSITKLAGEQMLLAADRLGGLPVVALRLGDVANRLSSTVTGARPDSSRMSPTSPGRSTWPQDPRSMAWR